jgi:hypothetical protein
MGKAKSPEARFVFSECCDQIQQHPLSSQTTAELVAFWVAYSPRTLELAKFPCWVTMDLGREL